MKSLEDTLSNIMTSLQLEDAPAGGSVVVFHNHKIIAEVSIGEATPHQKWDSKTLSLNFSTGKGVLVTLIHILVSQGLLDYEQPIAQYWPEFAQNNKQDIKLKDVLTHRSGLFNIQSITDSAEDMLDWQLMINRVAEMSAENPDNLEAESAYSALVSGWILSGLVEKVTGLALNDALNKYLANPLGLEGCLYFGVPDDKVIEVATLAKNFNDFETLVKIPSKEHRDTEGSKSKSTKPTLRIDTPKLLKAYQTLPNYGCWEKLVRSEVNEDSANNKEGIKTLDIAKLYFDMRSINLQDFKKALFATGRTGLDYYSAESLMAKIPAANNVASAKALATLYAMLANKGVWMGRQLISPEVFSQLSHIYVEGRDAIMAANHPKSMQWRLGYHRLFSRCHDTHSLRDAFGHMGYNGSIAWCDTKRNLAVAYVHNYDVTMSTDVRQFAIIESIIEWIDSNN